MLLFPNCKINLGLSIVAKRQDGYHDIQSVFLPVQLQDALEVITATNATPDITFTTTGLAIDGDETSNLCIKAYHLLKREYPQIPVINMHLHKAIPMGAGLGGGSADGAFTLLLLNKKYRLGIGEEQLIQYALQLGSDCPFFIINKPCYAEGRGEQLTPVEAPLNGYTIVLVNPGIHVPTGWAFSQLTPAPPAKNVRDIISQPIGTWKDELVNDFEVPVTAAYPQLANIKQQLYSLGATYAAMSGSGSTFYGLFEKKPVVDADAFEGCFAKQTMLLF